MRQLSIKAKNKTSDLIIIIFGFIPRFSYSSIEIVKNHLHNLAENNTKGALRSTEALITVSWTLLIWSVASGTTDNSNRDFTMITCKVNGRNK